MATWMLIFLLASEMLYTLMDLCQTNQMIVRIILQSSHRRPFGHDLLVYFSSIPKTRYLYVHGHTLCKTLFHCLDCCAWQEAAILVTCASAELKMDLS